MDVCCVFFSFFLGMLNIFINVINILKLCLLYASSERLELRIQFYRERTVLTSAFVLLKVSMIVSVFMKK